MAAGSCGAKNQCCGQLHIAFGECCGKQPFQPIRCASATAQQEINVLNRYCTVIKADGVAGGYDRWRRQCMEEEPLAAIAASRTSGPQLLYTGGKGNATGTRDRHPRPCIVLRLTQNTPLQTAVAL